MGWGRVLAIVSSGPSRSSATAGLTIFIRHERRKIGKGQRDRRTGMWTEDNGCE